MPGAGARATRPDGNFVFAAREAGAAAWMAPVWRRIPGQSSVALSATARAHLLRRKLALPPHVIDMEQDLPRLIERQRPRAVLLSATGDPSEEQIVAACRTSGVSVTQVVDTWGGYARRFGRTPPDAAAVIDTRAETECRAAGGPATTYVHLGQPAWEAAGRLPPADPRKVLVVGQPVQRFYGASLGYDEASVATMVRALARRRPDLISRVEYLPHPADNGAGGLSMDTDRALAEAGTIVGMFSSLLVDALLGGRKVIVVQPGRSPDLFGPSRHGLLKRCRTMADIEREIEAGGPAPDEALRRLLAGSTDRVLAHLGIVQCDTRSASILSDRTG